MFNLFKKGNTITKHYPELPPGERIRLLFEERIYSFLSKYGFKFVKSQTSFKRKVGEVTHEISVSKSKWNKGDEVCAFWLTFYISANTYKTWHQKKYGYPPLNNGVKGFYHNHLKNEWQTQFPLNHYNLSKQDNDVVFEEIKHNIERVVLPLFNKFTSYETAADELLGNKDYWLAAKIYDFYLIANKPEKAKEALLYCKSYFDKDPDRDDELAKEFQLRLKELNKTKHFISNI